MVIKKPCYVSGTPNPVEFEKKKFFCFLECVSFSYTESECHILFNFIVNAPLATLTIVCLLTYKLQPQ